MLMKYKLFHEGSREHIFPQQGCVNWDKVYQQVFDPKLAYERRLWRIQFLSNLSFITSFGWGGCSDIKTF